jgi:hypothetical protein
VVELLNGGASPQSIWDAILDGACELLMRRPGIVALHAVTTSNALHYAFRTSRSDDTRRYLLLQNAAFLTMFRDALRGNLADSRIEQIEPAALKGTGDEALGEIFDDVSRDRGVAAGKVFSYLQAGNNAEPLMAAARRLLFLKGNNAHDYKFSSAVLEDYQHVSPAWRDRYLASSVYMLRGAGDKDNELVKRVRAALA